ncbi:MAG: hypothetical protein Q7U73_18325 [Rubrivivax sp.]|nr:hypothetical protein [Rubrivivax sp.]
MNPVSLQRMNLTSAAQPRWSTTSVGDSADTQPAELSTLGEHVSLCRASGGRCGSLLRGAQAVHAVVASRFVTTLAVVVVVISALVVAF